MVDAGELSRMLAARAPALAHELLPGGRREGVEWRCGSLAGERGRSLGVRIAGGKQGVWADFASGERGDALDLVAAVLYGGDKRAAIGWAQNWLGLGGEVAPVRRPPPPEAEAARAREDEASRRSAALRLFLEARASLAGSPAAAYLEGRGIDLARLGRQPRSLRYHPSLWHRESGRRWPALVAAVTDQASVHVATHRTWLAQDDRGGWGKLRIGNAKMSLGRVQGGAIRLWRGGSGKPLSAAPDGEVVVLGEGIETCLSIALACPELRVLCAVSLGNMARVLLPDAVRTVIVAADNDTAREARIGLQRAANALLGQGREVRVAYSPVGKDFNDALRAA